jgi:hypothetical protein
MSRRCADVVREHDTGSTKRGRVHHAQNERRMHRPKTSTRRRAVNKACRKAHRPHSIPLRPHLFKRRLAARRIGAAITRQPSPLSDDSRRRELPANPWARRFGCGMTLSRAGSPARPGSYFAKSSPGRRSLVARRNARSGACRNAAATRGCACQPPTTSTTSAADPGDVRKISRARLRAALKELVVGTPVCQLMNPPIQAVRVMSGALRFSQVGTKFGH